MVIKLLIATDSNRVEESDGNTQVTVESSDEDMDLEEEAPDTTIKKKSGKKQKRGLVMRDQINKAAVELNNISDCCNLEAEK